jgi:multicomponent Na+:H+ antiporter subunit B
MSEVFIIDIVLLTLVAVAALAVVQVRSLFSATILAGVYSLLMALVWTNMHALDVAFTEAAVGAGISTILLLGAIVRTKRIAKGGEGPNIPAIVICLVTGAMLIYGASDMPNFGDPNAPIHTHRVPKLLAQEVGRVDGEPASDHHAGPGQHGEAEHGEAEHGEAEHPEGEHAGGGHPQDDFNGHVPNTVTSLLAAYRGFDTMFETTVIFVAGISLVLLLRRREDEEPVDDEGPEDQPEADKGWS